MRHACHYYSGVRSSVVAFNIIVSAVLAAAAPADPAVSRIEALPLAKSWTKTVEGPAPVAGAASATRFLAGWADRLDVFRIDTGEKEWSLPIPALRATCEAEFCVVADDRNVRGIDLTRRAVSWQRPIDGPLGHAPTLRSGWVILAGQTGAVRALQAIDGRDVWSFSAGAPLTGPASINGNQLVIAAASANVTLLDLSTGHPVWTVTLDHAPGAPRLAGERVFVGTEGGRMIVLDALDGRNRFETRTGSNLTGAPALDDKLIYSAGQDGVLRAFDRGNGAQRWYGNLPTRASDGPRVDGDLVFVPLRNGAIDVRLNSGKPVIAIPAPGNNTTRFPMAMIAAGQGATLSLLTVSYDVTDLTKWSLLRYASGGPIATSALPARLPGLALPLTAPR